jgi:hypothetical protein
LLLEGGYDSITVKSNKAAVTINGTDGCDNFEVDVIAIDATCADTDNTVTVQTLECPVTTELEEFECVVSAATSPSNLMMTMAGVGSVIVTVIMM